MTRLLLPLLLLALPSAANEAPSAEVAIYPGFAKDELGMSVASVVKAATACARSGRTSVEPETRPAVAPHLSAELIDGRPVELQERTVDLACGTKPVRRCSYGYVWASGSEQIGYASIQCLGSHDDAYTSYLVTASVDLSKARKPDVLGTKKDKALVLTSLTFQTDAFPGSHVTAFQVRRRRDGAVQTPPQVMAFDDFANTDEAAGALTPDEITGLSEQVLALSCTVTGACARSDAPPRGPDVTQWAP